MSLYVLSTSSQKNNVVKPLGLFRVVECEEAEVEKEFT
jgi:hypothetical protein